MDIRCVWPIPTFHDYFAEMRKWQAEAWQIHAIVESNAGRAMGLASYVDIQPEAGSIEVGAIMYALPCLQHTTAGTEAMYLLQLSGNVRPPSTEMESAVMHRVEPRSSKDANPNAPAELSRFALLVGNWRCEATLKVSDVQWQTFQATWVDRYILNGYAIEDEYRMMHPSGKLIVLGMNFRAYSPTQKAWNIKWLNAMSGTWTDLGPKVLGGVQDDGLSIHYVFGEPTAGHAYTRASYTNISEKHFTWRGEKSDDRKVWTEFMVVEAYRDGQ